MSELQEVYTKPYQGALSGRGPLILPRNEEKKTYELGGEPELPLVPRGKSR